MIDNLHDFTGQDRSAEQMQDQLDRLQKSQETSHSGGGGDGMEPRLAKLEAHMENVRSEMAETKSAVSSLVDRTTGVEIRLAGLEVKVDHLPSKGFIVTSVIAALALIAAMFGFQDQLQTFFGNAPPTAQ